MFISKTNGFLLVRLNTAAGMILPPRSAPVDR